MSRVALALGAMLCAPHVEAQLQLATISGSVVAQDGRPASGARLKLLDGSGAIVAVTEADDDGRFAMRRLAPGAYWLRAEGSRARSETIALRLDGGLAQTVVLRLAATASENVEVEETAAGSERRAAMAGDTVSRVGGRLGARALQTALAQLPGWSGEDGGLVHHQGVDDGFLYVVDGVPVYERMDALFGSAPDAGTIASVQVLSGYIPPEFGLKSGGVIELRSNPASERPWAGSLAARVAGEATAGVAALAEKSIGDRSALSAAFSAERSRRFLDPVHPDNFHNSGHQIGGQAEFARQWTRDWLTLRAGASGSRYDVPHGREQENARQDQKQSTDQRFQTASWQRAWADGTVSHAALYRRANEGGLRGSDFDTPLWAGGARDLGRLGALASVAHQAGTHTLKAGLELARLELSESFEFGVNGSQDSDGAGLSDAAERFTRENPFRFNGGVRRGQSSYYVQDSWRVTPRLELDFGARFDRTRLLLREGQLSPRLGVAFRAGRATTLRGALNRFYQPPQSEWLLLASSAAARALSPFAERGGGADILAERQTALELAIEHRLGALGRVGGALWQRRFRNQADPNVFFGTTVVFPNSVARGRARGLELSLELPRRDGWSGSLGYSLSKVTQFGPLTGGLFLEEDLLEIGPGTEFTPDHDQRHAATGTLRYDDETRGLSASALCRFQTGTPLEVPDELLPELATRPGAHLVDFEAGRVKPRLTVDVLVEARAVRTRSSELYLRLEALNLADARYAFNFGNPFSGTHFGSPRSLALGLRVVSR
jgi:outer membrane receptor protein involved in Fe transport